MVNPRLCSILIVVGIIIHGAGRNARWVMDYDSWCTVNRITEAFATMIYAWAINSLACRTTARLASEYLLILSVLNVAFIVIAIPTRFNPANYLAAALVTWWYVKYWRAERRERNKKLIH